MQLVDLLTPAREVVGLQAQDKHELLAKLALRAAADLGLDPQALLAALLTRERLGSTGMGGGTAIPHARTAAVAEPYGLLARLEHSIEFAAIDGRPVDLVCLLLLPMGNAGRQLEALACVARAFRNERLVAALRTAPDRPALHALLMAT